MIWLALAAWWLILSMTFIAGAVWGARSRTREVIEVGKQCGFLFERSGRRCIWYNGHPKSWGHRAVTLERVSGR